MQKAFKYRLYPTKAQETKLERTLDLCRELYNAALAERRGAYQLARKAISYYDQANQLPEIKEIYPDLNDVHSQVLQEVLKRVDLAFAAFFRRVMNGDTPGYPRFKGIDRYESFTFPQTGFSFARDKLRLSKIGEVKIRLHRQLEGQVKTLTIRREADRWYACFSVECDPVPLPKSEQSVGIDMGLESFAHFSDDQRIENPRFFRSEEKVLARAQRKLSVAPRGSAERRKRKRVVRKIHARIADRRRDFAHQEARKIVNRYGFIAIEALNVKGMSHGRLAKSIHDAAWSLFFVLLLIKAEEAGRTAVKVNPAYTSQTCHRCGNREKKVLGERWHDCRNCGFKTHRDHNAALNILTVGLHGYLGDEKEATALQAVE
jgi:putative transposase